MEQPLPQESKESQLLDLHFLLISNTTNTLIKQRKRNDAALSPYLRPQLGMAGSGLACPWSGPARPNQPPTVLKALLLYSN